MRFLNPTCTSDPHFIGVMTSAGHNTIPKDIQNGAMWVGENEMFGGKFTEERFFYFLGRMEPYFAQCKFIVAPDYPMDAEATLQLFKYFERDLAPFPLAYAAQDGAEELPFPPRFECLFVAGSTEWKESDYAVECIRRGQALGKHIHIGRVNYWKRYKKFAALPGSEHFTCDGTRPRFQGVDKTFAAWKKYESWHELVLKRKLPPLPDPREGSFH